MIYLFAESHVHYIAGQALERDSAVHNFSVHWNPRDLLVPTEDTDVKEEKSS